MENPNNAQIAFYHIQWGHTLFLGVNEVTHFFWLTMTSLWLKPPIVDRSLAYDQITSILSVSPRTSWTIGYSQ